MENEKDSIDDERFETPLEVINDLHEIHRYNSNSRYSVKSAYGDLDSEGLEVARQKTRETILDELGDQYKAVPTTDAIDHVDDDGHEYEDIDPELVAWEGPHDPTNPRNWPHWYKHCMTFLAALYLFIPPMASTMPSPAVTFILEDFDNHNTTVGALYVSIMLIAWTIFILINAPLSEVFGRRLILNMSMFGGLVFNIACAVAPNSAALLCFRFLCGAFICAPLAVAAGTIADLYDDKDRTWPLALFALGPSSGPAVAPVISGFVTESLGWKWTFWIASIANGLVLVIGFIFYRETYAPVLLARKAKKLRKETGNSNLHTIWEVSRLPFHIELRKALVRPILFLCTHPVVFALGLHMAFVYAFMYLMLVTFPALWTQHYGYSIGITGLMYISLFLGILIGTLATTPLMKRHYDKKAAIGQGRPEEWIYYLPASTVVMTVGLFWYGWSAQAHIHWIMPEIGVFLFGFGLFIMFQGIQTYLVLLNTRLASSIVAAAALFRTALGGTFPLFGRAMYNRLGYGWANTVCGVLMLILGVPSPIVMYLYGAQIRGWVNKHYTVK